MAEQQAAVSGEAAWAARSASGRHYPASLAEGSVVAEAYGETEVSERHRHRFEVNNAYREQITEGSGLQFRHLAGRNPGRVRRVPDRDPPLPGRHPGAPGVQVASDPPAPRCSPA